MPVMSDDISVVMGLEREMQSPAARANPARTRELLAPDFVEIGASGRRWDRESMLRLLEGDSQAPAAVIGVTGLEARHLTEDLIQVLWDSERDGRRARRSSLWRRATGGWRLVFHQGTSLP